jgi:hypothetical protein
MNDQELRALVRAAIARHTSGSTEPTPGPPAAILRFHPSHRMFMVPSGSDADGPCLIEPAVACNHCGFCKSYGH